MNQPGEDTPLIDFDEAAAARSLPEALDYYRERLLDSQGNQESAHDRGRALRSRLEEAAAALLQALVPAWRGGDVVWGNSGTDLLNLAAAFFAGKKVLGTPFEHPAANAAFTREAREYLQLAADAGGQLRAEGDWSGCELLHFPQVQGELGVIPEASPLIGRYRGERPRGTVFLDAVQAAGKLPLATEADLLLISGHKFGAPGGAALLVNPHWFDAGRFTGFARNYRLRDYRMGRPEVPLQLALAFAAGRAAARAPEALPRITELNRFLREELTGCPLPGGHSLRPTVAVEAASPYLLHLLLPGVETGVLVRMLSAEAVWVSAGSACSSESGEPSRALRALGLSRRDAFSGLRLSFSADSTREEAKKFCSVLKTVLKNY